MFLYSWSGFVYSCITHMMFINLLIFGAVQLQILQIKLRNVANNTQPITPKETTQLLKQLIVEHKNAINFINTLNEKTKSIVLMEFIFSSMDVASVARSLTNGTINISSLGWMFLFFILLSLQIFAMAWNTNEIKIQSLAISDAMFESSWYLMDKEGQQLTHIVMMRAQKPLAITIGPFGPMTTQSALLMFKAAYSYISIM
ncbi:hypothetical protein GWI33_017967 [Rhynchophorus ferrugineus]|uniref:Uncharacterized protein n=1 Tax=Rhynchophorus ferrugineus TaxID=354439 RepID=A0A834HX93_RHYFE|nr:hypothetical protein GWI33_017967 [Rhynchophorus ferrugineus]